MVSKFVSPDEAREIWNMIDNAEYSDDIEAHYKGLLNYLDIIGYRNGNSFDPPIITRHAMAYLAFSMPSLAYVDPSRTRELSYNLNVACDYLDNPLLVRRTERYNSDHMLLVEEGLSCAFYRLISGRKMWDEDFHKYAEDIYNKIVKNSETDKVWAINTLQGRFEVLPNAMALMIFELHDRFFGTDYSKIKQHVLDFMNDKLRDPKTGMYYECLLTGTLGYPNESIKEEHAWHPDILKPSVNGLALAFMNYFDPEGCWKAWANFKEYFMESLSSVQSEDICDAVGTSYLSQLAPSSEALLGAMLAAREMGDKEAFNMLQDRLVEIGKPKLAEGKIFYTELGSNQHLLGYFILFSRVHLGWKTLFEHPWEQFYQRDYNKVR